MRQPKGEMSIASVRESKKWMDCPGQLPIEDVSSRYASISGSYLLRIQISDLSLEGLEQLGIPGSAARYSPLLF